MKLFDSVIIPVTNQTPAKEPFMSYHTKQTIDLMWRRWPTAMEMYHDSAQSYRCLS